MFTARPYFYLKIRMLLFRCGLPRNPGFRLCIGPICPAPTRRCGFFDLTCISLGFGYFWELCGIKILVAAAYIITVSISVKFFEVGPDRRLMGMAILPQSSYYF
jgi:hypothetical protein